MFNIYYFEVQISSFSGRTSVGIWYGEENDVFLY